MKETPCCPKVVVVICVILFGLQLALTGFGAFYTASTARQFCRDRCEQDAHDCMKRAWTSVMYDEVSQQCSNVDMTADDSYGCDNCVNCGQLCSPADRGSKHEEVCERVVAISIGEF